MFIRNAIWYDPEDPIKWELDESLFAGKFLRLYPDFKEKMSNYSTDCGGYIGEEKKIQLQKDIMEELVDQTDFFKLSKEAPCILVNLIDQSKQTITNKSVFEIHGSYTDGARLAFRSDQPFVYCIFSLCAGQAGSLGIWDTRINNWCFSYRDEGFCVKTIEHTPESDCFFGTLETYHFASSGGTEHFKVSADRKLEIFNT